MKRKLVQILIGITVLTCASLACSFTVGGPSTPERTNPASNTAAQSLEQIWNTAIENASIAETVTVVFTEEQWTSFIALELTKNQDLPIQDPQVYLQNGQIEVYGKIQQGPITAKIRLDLQASVQDYGQVKLDIVAADFGPIPAPAGLLEALSKVIDETASNSINPETIGVSIESLTIADGTMTITGTKI